MVSFSCNNCGDVLTKKKLDAHRNHCYGSFTCLDCMVDFDGTAYRAHTSCITEDQKYQGKLYKEKKPKSQHQKKDSAQQSNTSQALVPRNAYVEDAPDAETGAVAIVDAPPRAPSPPPAAHSLGYKEPAALPSVNVFDFLDPSETPSAPRNPPLDESRQIEDSIPPPYEERPGVLAADVFKFQEPEDPHYQESGYAYGHEPVRPSNERFDSTYNLRTEEPSYTDPAYTTPAPKPKHSRTKSRDKDLDTTTKKTDRKRKRNSPAELDMALVRAQQERDMVMADPPPVLHSGLTGGLNRLLARPEFPPSPEYSGEYVENSPLSPMKRAKQGHSKAFARAQREWEVQQVKEENDREKEERRERERGRERERKPRKASTATTKEKTKTKRRDDSARASRRTRDSDRRRRRQYSSSPSPPPGKKMVKAIEYHRSGSQSPNPDADASRALIVRPNGELAPVKTSMETRAELFMSFVNKGPESERGMSVNKALKRYHRERYDRWDRGHSKAEEEKELWKNLRLRRNDRGEIVLFFSPADGE